VVHAIAIVAELVLSIKLKMFNFAAFRINIPALLRDAETLSDEVRNVHLNKSISTIAVQRQHNGIVSYERNMAAVVPVNSTVKFHRSEMNQLPVAVTEISSSSRWTYAFVSQNLAVNCLKRLLQRPCSPSFDPLTHNIHRVLHRVSWLLITVASVFLFAFVSAPASSLSMVLRSLAVILMPLLPSMVSCSLSLSAAAINASISSHMAAQPAADTHSRKASLKYSRLEDAINPSSNSSAWCCHRFISQIAQRFSQLFQLRMLPSFSEDNQTHVELSLLSVLKCLFTDWKRMFHSVNHMHMMSRVTVLCVLDKEGILAQPQPEARFIMYSRCAPAEDAAPLARSRSSQRTASTSAADIVDASFIAVPIIQNDNSGKWEFRFENDSEKSRSLEIFRQITVCAQLTTDKLDIDEDAPKPANSCVKGLIDLCTLINEQFDDKNVPVQDKVPIWKKHVDWILPGHAGCLCDLSFESLFGTDSYFQA
jgi:hypothetical protein